MSRYEAIYVRQSVEKDESLSPKSQESNCKKICKNKKNIKVYADVGFSGKNTKRPQLQRLLEDIQLGIIKRVIVYRLDRISRNVADFYDIYKIMQSNDCEFISYTEKELNNSAMGEAMMGILAIFAQLERRNIQTRVQDNVDYRITAHRWLAGKAPYGYRNSKTKDKIATLMPVNEELKVVKMLFKDYSSSVNISLHKLKNKLIEKGIKNQEGNNFSPQEISRLLSNPIYAKADKTLLNYFQKLNYEILNDPKEWTGEYSACVKLRTRKTKEPKQVYLTNVKPVIMSRQFISVQDRLAENKSFTSSNNPNNRMAELSGLVKCAECGYAVKILCKPTLSCSGRKRGRCTVSFRGTHLEDLQKKVDDEIDDKLKTLKDSIAKKIKKRNADIKEIDKLKMELNNLLDLASACTEGVPDELKNRTRELNTKIKTKQLKLTTDNADDIISLRLKSALGKTVYESIYDDEGRLIIDYASCTTEVKQMILRVLVDKILLHSNGDIDIVYKDL